MATEFDMTTYFSYDIDTSRLKQKIRYVIDQAVRGEQDVRVKKIDITFADDRFIKIVLGITAERSADAENVAASLVQVIEQIITEDFSGTFLLGIGDIDFYTYSVE
jgi:hypothetical protein